MPENNEYAKTYREDGFVIVRNLFGGDDLTQLSEELDEYKKQIESRAYRGNHMFEDDSTARVIFNPYDFCPSLRRLIDTPEVIGLVRELLGTPVRLDHTKFLCKQAKKGSIVHHHQDFYYWQDKSPNQVALFMAIDQCTEENGCLRLFPGSHKAGLREHKKQFHEVTGERFWECVLEPEYKSNEVKFVAEPGDVCFFSALAVHRSDPNTSAMNRRCVAVEFDEVGNLSEKPGWGSPIPAKSWE